MWRHGNPFQIFKFTEERFDLIWFYDISNIEGYLMPNPFYTYRQFYFKQVSLTSVHCLNVKTSSISSYLVKVKWFQVLLRITSNLNEYQSFIYTQLNVKTVLFQAIQLSISTQFSPI